MNTGEFCHHLSHSITRRLEFQRWAWEQEAALDSTIGVFDEADRPARRAMCRRLILSRCQITSRSALRFDALARAEFENLILEFNRQAGAFYPRRRIVEMPMQEAQRKAA